MWLDVASASRALAAAAARNQRRAVARQRRHHPGARPHRARGRDRRPARPGAALGAHEVPGRRPAGARGAGPGPGGRHEQRRPAGRAAQAPRRDRDDPRADRGPRHRPCSRCSPRTPSSPTRPGRSTRDMLRDAGIEPAPDEVAPADAARRLRPHRSVGSCRSRSSRASWPTPSSPPTSRSARQSAAPARRLASWELLGPLFRSFERGGRGSLALHGAARAVLPARPGRPAS